MSQIVGRTRRKFIQMVQEQTGGNRVGYVRSHLCGQDQIMLCPRKFRPSMQIVREKLEPSVLRKWTMRSII